jgi:hypothetical protein
MIGHLQCLLAAEFIDRKGSPGLKVDTALQSLGEDFLQQPA